MPRYKAKKSYLELKEKDNLDGMGSPSKHGLLVAGHEVTLDNVPEKIADHLQEIKEKTTKKKGDK
tara:strand:- start:1073 stop:1267 length:195 start_codon:yes stop_codon:yes gene_type:complete